MAVDVAVDVAVIGSAAAIVVESVASLTSRLRTFTVRVAVPVFPAWSVAL